MVRLTSEGPRLLEKSRPQTTNTKGRPLGERPAFLRSPPGCGVVEALGCVGRGFNERLGRPPAGYLDCERRARWLKALPFWYGQKPFKYEKQIAKTVSNERNLTNRSGSRHLQKCISDSGRSSILLVFPACWR